MEGMIPGDMNEHVRYANSWEDAQVLMEGLRIGPGDVCLSMSPAGDSAFSMLVRDPERVVAADPSPAQLACIELKMEALRRLSYGDLLEFLGVQPSGARLWVFSTLKHWLTPRARWFWENRPGLIEKGLIHAGALERFMRVFRSCVVPLVHSRKQVSALLSPRSLFEQRTFYRMTWSNFRWDLMLRVFFGRFVMARLGRAFKPLSWTGGEPAESLMKKIDLFFSRVSAHDSPFANYLFTGNYPLHALPHYLREENFDLIRSRLDRIELFHGGLGECLEHYRDTRFNTINLSNVFEGMNPLASGEALELLARHTDSGARVAFWSLLSDETPPGAPTVFHEQELSNARAACDDALFYKWFAVGTAN